MKGQVMIEPNNKKVLVIIPAYNEENNIERTINNIKDKAL